MSALLCSSLLLFGSSFKHIISMSVFDHQSRELREQKEEMSTAGRFYDMEQTQRRYQELVEENIWLKQQIDRAQHQDLSHCPHCTECNREKLPTSNSGDMALWSMLERNRYLQEKIGKLKGQYEKQARTLTSIRSSDKWKNRFLCSSNSTSCYEDKYLHLLKVKSPFY